jgi:mannose-6-phosphate isomerase-like protein (cupin superfamily)
VTIEPDSAAYFPAGKPHAVRAVGPDKVVYLYTYATLKAGTEIEPRPATEDEAAQVDIMNLPATRWAVSEDFEDWVKCEPSRGDGVQVCFLFDEERGKHPEMQVGIGAIGPNIHYTLHRHAMPEIYYVLGGAGLVLLDGEDIPLSQGMALYVPPNVVHGVDNFGSVPVRLYYIYGQEAVGLLNWQSTWTPEEDIYTRPRPRTGPTPTT